MNYTVHSILKGADQELADALLNQDWGKVEVAKEQIEDALTRIDQMVDLTTKLYNEGGCDV